MFKLIHTLIVLALLYSLPIVGYDIDQLTLEEKVGQLFIVYFDGEDANENAEKIIRKTKVGGIIYYNWSNSLSDPLKIQQLSRDLQSLASQHIGIPLFISVDQEGGVVARLQNGFTEFPGNGALGKTSQPKLANKASYYMGLEMRAVGINFNLAPVVDINNNPANPIIGIRSFGDDKEIVCRYGKESLHGFLDAGIIPCLKHFPGHGDVTVDSHLKLPVVSKKYSEIEQMELYPFIQLADEAPAIMTAHILFPLIDPQNCATLSSHILQKILREKLNFRGVLVTDSLTMQSVLEQEKSLDEVILKAFEAGNDILLIGGRDLNRQVEGDIHIDEVIHLYQTMLEAIRCGRISEQRLDESVNRILNLKEKMNLFERVSPTEEDLFKALQCKKHFKVAHEISRRSLSFKEGNLLEDLSKLNITIIAPKILEEKIMRTDLMMLGKSVTLSTFEDFAPSEDYKKHVLERIKNTEYVIFCSYNSWKTPEQLELLQSVSRLKPTVTIAVRDPYDLDIPHCSTVKIATYSPTSSSLQAAAEWLMSTPTTNQSYKKIKQ